MVQNEPFASRRPGRGAGWEDAALGAATSDRVRPRQPIGASSVWTVVMTVGEPSEEGGAGAAAVDGPSIVATVEPASARGAAVLEAVYRNEYPRLVALARLLIDRQVEAEEIVQEAFVRALAGWERLEHRDDP